jgi:tRNA(Arg) A34 adenosine deaminase TadA
MDALEYGRMIHAEMSAICDAARLGRKLEGTTLYTTTFPCHMCAKHIVAAGITDVVFLEPYPKSLASELHSDSIHIEGQSREQYDEYPAAEFSHFYGICTSRYRELFERKSRKSKDGLLQERKGGLSRPAIDITLPVYLQIESSVISTMILPLLSSARLSLKDLPEIDFETSAASLSANPGDSAPAASRAARKSTS